MLNPIWLNTFKTLIEVGHFTQTAEKLFMTQPGVSQHIKKLEQSCGKALIKRENKSFEITEQGKLVYDYACQMHLQEELLLERINFDDPYSGRCQIGCSGSLALLLYPMLLAQQSKHPGLHIHMEAAPNHKILNDLQQGTIDIGLVTESVSSSLFQTTCIGKEPLCLVLPKQYKNTAINADTLLECGVITHPNSKHYLSYYFEHCDVPDLANLNVEQLPVVSYINQLNQILVPITQGIGFTVLPKSTVDSLGLTDQLCIHQPKADVYEDLYLVQKKHRELPSRYDLIQSTILNALDA